MPFFLASREHFGLEQKLRLLLKNEGLVLIDIDKPGGDDELISLISSSGDLDRFPGPGRAYVYIIEQIEKREDFEKLDQLITKMSAKLDADEKLRGRLRVLPILFLRSREFIKESFIKELNVSDKQEIPIILAILDDYRESDGLEVPLSISDKESQLTNVILMNENDSHFAEDLGRSSRSWILLTKAIVFCSDWLAHKDYQEIIGSVRQNIFGGERKSIVLDEDKVVESAENDIFGMTATAFIQASRLDAGFASFLKKSFVTDYSEGFIQRLRDKCAALFAEGSLERARRAVIEKLKQLLKKDRDLGFIKDSLPRWFDQLGKRIGGGPPLEQLYVDLLEEVQRSYLVPKCKQMRALRIRIIKRLGFIAAMALSLVVMIILALETNIVSPFLLLKASIALLLVSVALVSFSKIEISSMTRRLPHLQGILDEFGKKRRESVKAGILSYVVAFLKKTVEYATAISKVLDEENRANMTSRFSRFLEFIEVPIEGSHSGNAIREIQEAIISRAFKLWYEEPAEFRDFYEEIRRAFVEAQAASLDKGSIVWLSKYFNDYDRLNTIMSSFPVAYVPDAGQILKTGRMRIKSILGVSSDLVLATDQLIGKYEYRQLSRQNTIIYGHFLPIQSALE